jgi:hypothetical protein
VRRSALLPAAGTSGRRALVVALVGWVWARCCVAAGFVVAHAWGSRPGDVTLSRGLLAWDGIFYVQIARDGYGGGPEEAVRFFPLFPVLARVAAPLFLGREDVAVVVIANVGALIGAALLWHLAAEVLRDAGVADRSAWMVALVPAAFVLVLPYTEGMALTLVSGVLLYLHRRQWWAVAGLAAAAAALRPVGVLLMIPIGIELLRCRPRPRLLPAAAALGAPAAGLVVATAWIARTTGSLTSAFDAQQPIRDEFRNPVVRSLEAGWSLFHDNWTDVENVPFIVLWGVLLVVSVWKRQPWSWVAYSAVTLLVATSAQTLDSLGRYGLLAVPLVIALAQWTRPRWSQLLVAVGGSAGLVVLTAAAITGRIVP